MSSSPSFTDLLALAQAQAAPLEDEGILSLALAVAPVDPLRALAFLPSAAPFKALWDGAPGLCMAATGVAQHLELSGPRRFELAQRFSQLTLGRLGAGPPPGPPQARPRVWLAFSRFGRASCRERVSSPV